MKIIGWLFLLFFPLQLFSQTELEIRFGDYLTGEAIILNEKEEDARNLAKKELIQSIFQTIVLNESFEKSEVNGVLEDRMNIYLESFSSIELKGVKYLRTETKNGNPLMIAYISEADYRKSIDDSIEEIRSLVREGELTEAQSGLPDASRYYYDAWLRTFAVPVNVRYVSAGSSDTVLVKTLVRKKLTSFLESVYLQTVDIDEEMEAHYTVRIKALHLGKLVRHLRIVAKDPSIDAQPITDGVGKLYVHRLPGALKESVEVILLPPIDEKNQGFQRVDQANSLQVIRKFDIDFRPLIEFDFKTEKKAAGFIEFTPQIRNFSVSKLSWNFGNGYQAIEARPSQKFDKPGRYKVTLEINKEFRVIKEINEAGTVFSTVHQPDLSKPLVVAPVIEKTANFNRPEPSVKRAVQSNGKIKDDLLNITTGDLIFDYLNASKQAGKLTFGTENQFTHPDECLVVVVDKNSRNLLGILEKENGKWINFKNQETIQSLKETFKGQIVVWVQIF